MTFVEPIQDGAVLQKKSTTTFLAIACLLLAAAPAAEGALIYTPNTYGLSARGIALVNALTADDQDIAGCYYNPAGLASVDLHGVGMSYIYTAPNMEGGLIGGERVKMKKNNKIVVLNVRSNIRKLFSERLRLPPIGLGFSVAVDNNFMTMMYFDDMRSNEGAFDRYGKSNMVMQGAVGVGVTSWLSLGIGFHGGFRGKGEVTTRAEVSGESSNEGTSMEGSFSPVPLGGVFVHGASWGVGLTYREETYGAFDSIKVSAYPTLAGLDFPVMKMPMNFFDTFVPREIAMGVSKDIGQSLTAFFDLTWREWSRYEVLAGREEYVGSHSEFHTIDIWTPRFAAEWEISDRWIARGGYRYEQTPFRTIGTRYPEGGETIKGKAILDNDVHVSSLGFGYQFKAGDFFSTDIRFDGAYQLHYLAPREARTSDGYVYDSEGFLHLVAAAFEMKFD